MSCTLNSERVHAVLERLQILGDEHDAVYTARVRAREAQLGDRLYGAERARLGARAPQSVAPEVGTILYALVMASRPALVIEFGASFGCSTVYLAAALNDLGDGRLITSELIEEKAWAAAENLAEAGLADLVEVRGGDALATLAEVEDRIDMLFLDGSNDLYLPVLRMLEPRLARHAIIAADLSHGDPHHENYREYMRDRRSGYIEIEIPVDAGLAVSTPR